MTRIRFEDLPSTNTPRNAENLNKLNNVVISPTEPTTGEEVWIQKGKNLFDKNNGIVSGRFISSDGSIGTDETLFYQTVYISVKPNTTYTISNNEKENHRIAEYTNDKTFIRRLLNDSGSLTYTFTTSSNCYHIRVSCKISNLDSLQIEQGSATAYEPYIKKKIHIKNNNDDYEDFYSEKTTVFNGSLYGGQTLVLDKVKRFLDVYFTMSNEAGALTGKYTIDTTLKPLTYGSVVLLAHDTDNSLEYYVSESSYNSDTNTFTHKRTGFFNISNGTYTPRGSTAYYVYHIETYD